VGAKSGAGVWQQIISQMPPHTTYIEPFLGTGAVLLRKKPARSTIAIDIDAAAVSRLAVQPGTTVICGDGIRYLRTRRWTGGELVYCDPPYLMSSRSCPRRYYRHEFSDADHERLLDVLLGIPCPVILSGYASKLYANKIGHWRTHTFTTSNRAGQRVTECLWMNFPEPFEYHDTRFMGTNFRERERIKRKKLRWVQFILRMSTFERAAILDAVNEARSTLAVFNPSGCIRERDLHPGGGGRC
jgi:DNA adenine methylase